MIRVLLSIQDLSGCVFFLSKEIVLHDQNDFSVPDADDGVFNDSLLLAHRQQDAAANQ